MTTTVTTTQAMLIESAREALKTWDRGVTMTDAEILDVIGRARTVKTALAKLDAHVDAVAPADPVLDVDAAAEEIVQKAAAELGIGDIGPAPRKRKSAATRKADKSGDPQADRAARAAKAEAKQTKRLPGPPARSGKTPKVSYDVPDGYVLKYPHARYDFLRKTDKTVEGPVLLVVCTQHAVVTGAKDGAEAREFGKNRSWCEGCATGKPFGAI